ncbi:8225_t:CDS:2 [Paraglomus occultum]|uniref:8225_t:CDS:1 n=1 Tax=Paraglomus occultum TaxID=144539 RepID=A0A9N9F5F2_9GLOM|nr:8225_t:CDS:2 [Paraglomus occultum]
MTIITPPQVSPPRSQSQQIFALQIYVSCAIAVYVYDTLVYLRSDYQNWYKKKKWRTFEMIFYLLLNHHLFCILFLVGGATFTLHFVNIPWYGESTVDKGGNCSYTNVESSVVYGFAAMSAFCGSVFVAVVIKVWNNNWKKTTNNNDSQKRPISKIALEDGVFHLALIFLIYTITLIMILALPNTTFKFFNSDPGMILTSVLFLRLVVLGKPSRSSFRTSVVSTASTEPVLPEPYTIQSAVFVRPVSLARATIVEPVPTHTSMLLSFGSKADIGNKHEGKSKEEWTTINVDDHVDNGGANVGFDLVDKIKDEGPKDSSSGQEDRKGGVDDVIIDAGEVESNPEGTELDADEFIHGEGSESPDPVSANISQAILIRRDTVKTISRNSMSGRTYNPTLVVHMNTDDSHKIKRSLTLPNLMRNNSFSKRRLSVTRQRSVNRGESGNGVKRVKSLPKLNKRTNARDVDITGNNSD